MRPPVAQPEKVKMTEHLFDSLTLVFVSHKTIKGDVSDLWGGSGRWVLNVYKNIIREEKRKPLKKVCQLDAKLLAELGQ